MTRALAPLPLLLIALGCEPGEFADRVTIDVGAGDPMVRMDLDPLTLTEVDNFVDVSVSLAADDDSTATTTTDDAKLLVLTQYRIDYGFGDACGDEGTADCAPYIAGELYAEIAEGDSTVLVLRGAVSDQTNWVWSRYTGGEYDVPARVSFAGVFDDSIGVTLSAEYTATFADYR